MNNKSAFKKFTRRFIGCVKTGNKKKVYFLFLPVFKVVKQEQRKRYYMLGIHLFDRKRWHNIVKAEIGALLNQTRSEINSSMFHLRTDILENKVVSRHLHRKTLNKESYILLFDHLNDTNIEAIDAWSLFQYMQSQGIPAKYVLNKGNKLAASQKNNPDVILIRDQNDFLFRCYDIIAGANCVLTSFGLDWPRANFIKRLPFIDYIFIEHGVTYFKEHVTERYNPTTFSKILVSSKGSYQLYQDKKVWQRKDMLLHGMPRWDLLARKAHPGKNIFIFYTWRTTFQKNPDPARAYFNKILSLVSNPAFRKIAREKNITVNLALHHTLMLHNVPIPSFGDYVRIINMDQISSHIGTTDLLITDYSSICFDFMFLDIPVIFYRFDFDDKALNEVDTNAARYARSKDAELYNCVYNEDAAVKLIENYAHNDFKLEEENIRKNEAFFWEKKDVRKNLCETLKHLGYIPSDNEPPNTFPHYQHSLLNSNPFFMNNNTMATNSYFFGTAPLLSIIIPVYNVAPYLKRCLNSLCSQDYTNLEIICVDDGSTDDSLAILREYEMRDKRVRVAHQENSGTSTARNRALDMATGDWITCVDPDDYMLPRSYSTLMKYATDEVDIVIFEMQVETTFESMKSKVAAYQSYVKLEREGIQKIDVNYKPDGNTYLCNKLYRRSIIEEHHLRLDPQVCVCEDKCWHLRYCAYARAAYILPKRFYVYDLRESSTMFGAKKLNRWTLSFLRVFDNIISTYREEGRIEEFAPWMLRLLRRTQGDVCRWAFQAGTALSCHENLVQLIQKHHLQDEPSLLPTVHEINEQHRAAVHALELLKAACLPAIDSSRGSEAALHVVIPLNEGRAGTAVLLAQSLKEHAGERALCIHFLCDDVNALARGRMAQLEDDGGTCAVRIHECNAELLHKLPPQEQAPYPGYLKMALPQILPNVSRVLVIDPGVLVTGELPDFVSLDMEGMPVAVVEDWPVVGKRETSISNVEMQHYVSPALMLMDLDLMREQACTDSWIAACMLRPTRLANPEHQSFNLAFQGRMAFLPPVESWLVKLKVPSVEVTAYHQNSPWRDFPLNVRRLHSNPPAPSRPAPKAPAKAPQKQQPSAVHKESHNVHREPTESQAERLQGQYGTLLRRYRYYKLMAQMTWGKRRRHYNTKREHLRGILRDIRALRREALDSCGLK